MSGRFCPHCMHTLAGAGAYCSRCGRSVNEAISQDGLLPIGTVLHGNRGHSYLVGKSIGGGGFGVTYVARDQKYDQVVAIKEYFPLRCMPSRHADGSLEPNSSMGSQYAGGLKSFMSEATLLQAVSNVASVVHVVDFFESNGTAYMVMEYLDGNTLRQVVESKGRFDPATLFQKMVPLMDDLSVLHDAGVIHRDLAPDNIMLMPNGMLKLLDFGCARSMEDGKSMEVMLKPGFAPAEQYGRHGQGPHTDIYALCATIYYCLMGEVPADAPSRLMNVSAGSADPLVSPSARGVSISPEVEHIILWGMNIKKEDRPQRMSDLAAALRRCYPQIAPNPAQPAPAQSQPNRASANRQVLAQPAPAQPQYAAAPGPVWQGQVPRQSQQVMSPPYQMANQPQQYGQPPQNPNNNRTISPTVIIIIVVAAVTLLLILLLLLLF